MDPKILSFIQFKKSKEEEIRKEYRSMIDNHFKDIFLIHDTIMDLSMEHSDNGFNFECGVMYSDRIDGGGYVIIDEEGDKIVYEFNNDEFVQFLNSGTKKKFIFRIEFITGSSSGNLCKEFAAPMLNRITTLYPDFKFDMIFERDKYKGEQRRTDGLTKDLINHLTHQGSFINEVCVNLILE